MLESNDKRQYHRMHIDCPARCESDGGGQTLSGAIVKNLSGGGMLLWTEQALDAGSTFRVTIDPVTTITPSFTAEIEVLRSTEIPESEGAYSAACKINRVL